jgi:hypothetical protein
MSLSCDNIKQEKFLNYDFDTIIIKNLYIKNNDGPVEHVIGKTYLFASFSAYGHSLIDVYAQYRILQMKYLDIKPFFYEIGNKGLFFNNNKVNQDLIINLGYENFFINDISSKNYLFEEVILFFDMNNTFPENFYKLNGAKRDVHYFPFCSCYLGTQKCGDSVYFKYNYLAIDILKKDFNKYFIDNQNAKIFISREKYNNEYLNQILSYSKKEYLSKEDEYWYRRAQIRYYKDEKKIEKFFVENGYISIKAEDYSLIDQIKIFSQATKIASISGTGLFNCFWCKPDTSIIEISAVSGFSYHYKEFAQHCNMKYFNISAQNLSPEEIKILLSNRI